MTGKGVVCFISNFSYLGDPSFVVMRQRFLGEFDKLWFDCLNGDSRETGKLTPDGKPDPSVFSTEYNREGIRVGTAIALMVRKAKRDAQAGRALPAVLGRHQAMRDLTRLLEPRDAKVLRRGVSRSCQPGQDESLLVSSLRSCRALPGVAEADRPMRGTAE